MKSFQVQNDSVSLHVLEAGEPSESSPSLLIVGGIWESAERAIPLLTGVLGHAVAFSFRGRGLSSTPDVGYTLADHLADIEAVVDHCRLDDYVMLGFSRGGAYALAWSLQHQARMRGLILVDQPPVHTALSGEQVGFWRDLVYRGRRITEFMRAAAIEGLGREAREQSFGSRLGELRIPVTLFIGRASESEIGSNVSDAVLDHYLTAVPQCKTVYFRQSGHMIPDDESEKYLEEVRLALDQVSTGEARSAHS